MPKLNLKDCQQCGKCCRKYNKNNGLESISKQEYDQLPKYAQKIADNGYDPNPYYSKYPLWNIWMNKNNEFIDPCPFLKKIKRGKYICKIHKSKPNVCKNYPVEMEQAIMDGCKRVKVLEM